MLSGMLFLRMDLQHTMTINLNQFMCGFRQICQQKFEIQKVELVFCWSCGKQYLSDREFSGNALSPEVNVSYD